MRVQFVGITVPLNEGSQHLARTAPFCVEINEDDFIILDSLSEVFFTVESEKNCSLAVELPLGMGRVENDGLVGK